VTFRKGRPGEARTVTDGSGVADPSFSLDDLLDILGHRYRRLLLEFLSDEDDPAAPLDVAVDCVTNRIAEETGRRPNEDDVEIELRHHHVPRLADDEVHEYDARSGTIRYYGSEQLEAFHEHVRAFDVG
jgi:hypothetical protein